MKFVMTISLIILFSSASESFDAKEFTFSMENEMVTGLKEQIMFAMSSGKAKQLSTTDLANYLTSTMRQIFGGHWSLHANPEGKKGWNVYQYRDQYHAKFNYDSLNWILYMNECRDASNYLISDVRRQQQSQGYDNRKQLQFFGATEMTIGMQDKVLSVLMTFDLQGYYESDKAKYLVDRMGYYYGDQWAAHIGQSGHSFDSVSRVNGTYGAFEQNSLRHVLYQVLC